MIPVRVFTRTVFVYFGLLLLGGSHGQAADETLSAKTSKLLDTLLTSYNKDVSPQERHSEPVKLDMSASLNELIDLDEKKGLMTTSWFPHMTWVDPRLQWKLDEYNLTYLTIPAQKLWVPDFEIYNNIRSGEDLRQVWGAAVVTNEGQLTFVPHFITETPCKFNLQSFPFDEQTCTITGGSWTMSTDRLSITAGEKAIWHDELESDDMTIQKATMKIQEIFYPIEGLTHGYSQVDLIVTMKRKNAFYYRLFVAPGAIMMFVLPIVHFLPPDPSKLTLSALLLVATTIIFEMMDDFFPSFSLSSVPLLLHYYTALLVLIFVGLFINALSIMIGTGTTKSARVPRILKAVCLDKLGYICCVRGRTSRYDYELLHLERSLRYSANQDEGHTEIEPIPQDDIDENHLTEHEVVNNAANNVQPTDSANQKDGLTEVLKTLINELQHNRYKQQVQAEWTQLAMVIDRVCGLFILLFAIIITSVVVLHK